MIVYVSEKRLNLLDSVFNELLIMEVSRINANHLNNFVVGSGANFSHANTLIVDLSGMKDTGNELIQAFGSFRTLYPDAKVIVIADGKPPDDPIFARLFALEIYNIVVNLADGSIKKCLTVGMTKADALALQAKKPEAAYKTEQSKDTAKPQETITANKDFKKHRRFISVAVCGTEPHIGATHHALLIAKFLSSVGFKTCYLEAHKRQHIVTLSKIYAVNADMSRHLLQFGGVDMYFGFNLSDFTNAEYDFYIFDLGRFGEFEPATLLTKDIKLIVGGVKAWEKAMYPKLFEFFGDNHDVRFLMNHAPPDERDGIRRAMNPYRVYFAEYTPYPFADGVNLDAYKEIFADYLTIQKLEKSEIPKEKKNRLFGFGKRGDK